MAKDDKSQIDIPATAAPSKANDDFVIHVMPKEFKGKKSAMKQPAPVAKPVPPPQPAPKPVVPVAPKQQIQKKGRRSTVILILIGVIIILLFLVGALFVLNSLNEQPVETPDVPVETPDEPDEPVVPDEPVEDTVTQGVDTDSDGLTDAEESLYGTDFRNPDTDADSFLDGNEVFHRYDPLGYAPSTLLDTGSVEIYSAVEDGGYSVYYPREWMVQESFDPGTGMTSEVTFHSTSRATIHVSAFPIEEDELFIEWYEREADTSIDFRDLLTVMSKEGYEGYISPDKLTTYLYTERAIYRFVYDLDRDRTIEYLQTFQMMVNSFVLP